MENRFYPLPQLDLERLARDLEGQFSHQGYQVQHFGTREQIAVQIRKGGEIEGLVGLQAALTVSLQRVQGGVTASIGEHQWLDKAAVGAIGMFFLWPLMITAGAGLIRQAGLETQIYNALDAAVYHQTGRGPQPQGAQQRQGAPQPSARPAQPQQVPCPQCQALNDADDAFCSYCGKSLQQAQPQAPKQCEQCGAQLKPDAAFCAKCGHAVAREESRQ
ncbi:hypothetical protein KSD_03470 [Ktedonobacter sp. SOSP1-85]|uniref:zinc ribbon domain-containing protein n=1 Tax=Ktedonobacter sp. SOSP1-85 TaxID=2778367 RepID=UPI00191673E8|nr:zinc ribbon domain-containing protein [Ktedonobacter sp. SOSP1-85]GHO72576.1 hypothetical protein KSD_03470 [Ktedonobacter sp. SOSP1-85]